MVDIRAKSSIYSIIVLIGAIIGIAGIFLAWFQADVMVTTISSSGWDIIQNAIDKGDFDLSDGYYRWMPLIVLVFAVIAALNSLVSIARPGRTGGIIAVISGLLMIIAAILFITYSETDLGVTWFKMSDYLGVGVYLAIVAGALSLIFGALMSTSKAINE